MRSVLSPGVALGLAVVTGAALFTPAAAGDTVIGYLAEARKLPPALSNLDETPGDLGLAGALLGVADNNTTGKFTGQHFALEVERLDAGGDAAAGLARLQAAGIGFALLDLEAETLARLLAAGVPDDMLLFNVAAPDERFRDAECHPALLHTALSRSMQTDALAQFLVRKRWREWFLVTGPRAADRLYADALRRSAKKFGAEIVAARDWSGDFDARRLAQVEVPLFTQGPDYDVLVVADEIGDFGDFLPFNTWDPRPVAGTQGLTAASWGRPVEQWGAAQLQERFSAAHRRWMRPRDYAAWLALRTLGEATLRSGSSAVAEVDAYIRSDAFQLAGFKGRKMSYRAWNGQLRQPVPLMWARALVSQAPLEGYLHQRGELDTLGLDEPESRCDIN